MAVITVGTIHAGTANNVIPMKVDLTGDNPEGKAKLKELQWVGIPCGIGIGTTKTLAKLANHVAKTAERKPGSYPEQLAQVCNLAVLTPIELESVFAATPVNEV